MANSLIIYLVAYIGLLFLISWFVSRKQKEEDYLIAGRNRKGWQIMLSKFSASIGAGYFITYTSFAYEFGTGVFAMALGLIVGFLLFAFWAAPKIARGSREGKFYTIGHFVYSKLNNKLAKKLADFFSIAVLFGWLLVGIVGSGKIIADFGLLSYNFAVIATSLVVLFYLLLAGYRAVILTDVVQSIVIFVLMLVTTLSIVKNSSLAELHSFSTGNFDLTTAIAFFFFGVLSMFAYSDRYQLSYAAKNERGLKNGLGLAIIPVFIVAYFLFLIGVFMATKIPGLDPGLVFTEALKQFLDPSLVPLAVVLFFAGIMSSADTNIYGIASHYAFGINTSQTKVSVRNVRKSIIGLTIFVTILAILFPNVVAVSIIAGAITILLSFAMIYVIAGGKNINRFFGSIAGACLGFVLGILFFGLEPSAAMPIIALGSLGLLYKGIGRARI